jgi:hypothetical protein
MTQTPEGPDALASANGAEDNGIEQAPNPIPPTTNEQELDDLARQIATEHEAAERAFGSALQHAIRCGELLIEAKTKIGHGEWIPWLAIHARVGERTAQAYMQVARRKSDLLNPQRAADLSVRGALALLQEHMPSLVAESQSQPSDSDGGGDVDHDEDEDDDSGMGTGHDDLQHDQRQADGGDDDPDHDAADEANIEHPAAEDPLADDLEEQGEDALDHLALVAA